MVYWLHWEIVSLGFRVQYNKKSFFFKKVNKVLLVKSKTKYSNSKEIEKKVS